MHATPKRRVIDDYKIVPVARLSGTRFCADAHIFAANMIQEGVVSAEEPMLYWDDKGLFAVNSNNTCIGMITYSITEHRSSLFLKLGYVVPLCRGAGVYSRLWRELVATATDLGLDRINAVTAPHNKHMRTVAARQGRTEISIGLEYKIERGESHVAPRGEQCGATDHGAT